MQTRSFVLALALFGLGVSACGDDEGGSTSPSTDAAMSPSTGVDAAVPGGDASQAPVDAARPMDAASTPDGARPATDASRGDSGSRADGAMPMQRADAGAQPPADSGMPMMSAMGWSSAACLSCEKSRCKGKSFVKPEAAEVDFNTLCDQSSNAAACKKVLECGRRTGCAAGRPERCLCGDLDAAQCESFDATMSVFDLPGACAREIIEASGSMELDEVYAGLIDLAGATGPALELLRCSEAKCANECFAPCASKSDGTVCDNFDDQGERKCTAGKCPDGFFDSLDLSIE